jgi:hypothetical protein
MSSDQKRIRNTSPIAGGGKEFIAKLMKNMHEFHLTLFLFFIFVCFIAHIVQ